MNVTNFSPLRSTGDPAAATKELPAPHSDESVSREGGHLGRPSFLNKGYFKEETRTKIGKKLHVISHILSKESSKLSKCFAQCFKIKLSNFLRKLPIVVGGFMSWNIHELYPIVIVSVMGCGAHQNYPSVPHTGKTILNQENKPIIQSLLPLEAAPIELSELCDEQNRKYH